MVKHTQTIRRQIAAELFQCVWPFCEIAAERVKGWKHYIAKYSSLAFALVDE